MRFKHNRKHCSQRFACALLATTIPGFIGVGLVHADELQLAQAGQSDASDSPAVKENGDRSVYQITKDALFDTVITAKLKTALYEDGETTGKDIHVATREGVVTLWGDVPNTEIAKRAEDLARLTNGVHEVVNMLQLKQSNG